MLVQRAELLGMRLEQLLFTTIRWKGEESSLSKASSPMATSPESSSSPTPSSPRSRSPPAPGTRGPARKPTFEINEELMRSLGFPDGALEEIMAPGTHDGSIVEPLPDDQIYRGSLLIGICVYPNVICKVYPKLGHQAIKNNMIVELKTKELHLHDLLIRRKFAHALFRSGSFMLLPPEERIQVLP
ncbi:uncharacterized protein LOC117170084 [Belonocnema kinseyi]|uniref:uncharacterized protein LOC117170084 n=1 Tax=Belonocnema kinseyi TaxID=2817044 RepID=UPI00143DB42D|nr:uncharacterized protein LOC117170084 [Belonocnema kinseyi]